MGLENRIQTMNNDMIKLDILVSFINVKPDEITQMVRTK